MKPKRAHFIQYPNLSPQAYIMELILRAPAVPEWFKPIGKFPWDRRLTEDEQLEKRFFEWPSYYARAVLKSLR